jgi:hypothetical protein
VPSITVLAGEHKIFCTDDAKAIAKRFVGVLKEYYWKPIQNVTRERNLYVKWIGAPGSGMIDPHISMLVLPVFYEKLCLERFTVTLELKAAAINWCQNDSVRLAHVLTDHDASEALRFLTHGASREEMDKGLRKSDAFDIFATIFNNEEKMYEHPCPANGELFSMDPNYPSAINRTGEKLKSIYRSIQAELTRATANYSASGQNGEKPFWSFCNGNAVVYLGAQPAVQRNGQVMPWWCVEEGACSTPTFEIHRRKRKHTTMSNASSTPSPSLLQPANTMSIHCEAEEHFFESQTKLANMQLLDKKLETLERQLQSFGPPHPMHDKIQAKIMELMEELLQ